MLIRSGEWLVLKRSQLGMTQREFAKMCDLTLSTIQNIEQGKRLGSSETWDKIEMSLNHLGDDSLLLSNNTDVLSRLKDLLNKHDRNHPIYIFYEFNQGKIIFTDFALPKHITKFRNTVYKDRKYMKTTLIETFEIFKYQNKVE